MGERDAMLRAGSSPPNHSHSWCPVPDPGPRGARIDARASVSTTEMTWSLRTMRERLGDLIAGGSQQTRTSSNAVTCRLTTGLIALHRKH
jgi:hypothetical protein